MATTAKVLVYRNAEDLALAAAERFAKYARDAIGEQGRFSVALAGGHTPKRVYEILACKRFKDRIQWSRVDIFFGDERCVPPDHPDSNYLLVYQRLISHVPLSPERVHRMIGEGDPASNARLYEQELKSFFGNALWPRFDLVLLGMGDDAHTASLFPGTTALGEQHAWVVANRRERSGGFRITLTAPAISAAAKVIFLVTGSGKAARLAEVLEGQFDPQRLPAQLIKSQEGSPVWMVDTKAASGLRDTPRRTGDR